MIPLTLRMRFRSWLAGLAFTLAGNLDPAYDVWLDNCERKDDPVAVPYSLERPWDCSLSHDDRVRLWLGMGNDPADLTDDLTDDELHTMVARFTSNA